MSIAERASGAFFGSSSASLEERRTIAPRRRLFPGDRAVWQVAAAVGLVFALLIGAELAVPRDFYTGTNSVRVRSFPAEMRVGSRLCLPDLQLPAGTGRVQFEVTYADLAPFGLSLRAGGRTLRGRLLEAPQPGIQKVDFAIPRLPSAPAFTPARACLTARGKLFVGGMGGLPSNMRSPTLDGQPLNSRLAVWYRPPTGETRSLISLAPQVFRRAALFRPGFVGAWTYWVLILGMVPLLLYGGVRLLATATLRRGRLLTLGRTIAVLAFLNAAAWALITPAFQAPDESEHFAYGQYFAETGKAIGSTANPSVYSTDEILALDAVRLASATETGDGKPPWNPLDQRRWEQTEVGYGGHAVRADGGASTTATAPHSPLYYSLLAPAYWAASGGSIFSQLTAMRLVSALLGALVAACGYLIVRELVPRRPVVAVAAGLMVAFQPMFAFMSGSVNNDMGVNAAGALLLYLLVRGLVRGLSPPLAIGIGAALIVTPLMKGTGYELYPAALVAIAGLLLRYRSLRTVRNVVVLGASAVVLFEAWSRISPIFHRTAFTTPGGNAPGAGLAAFHQFGGYLTYLWEVFLPRLPFMADHWAERWPAFEIYGVRGWADFGWYAQTFDHWAYWLIVCTMLGVAVLSTLALWRRWREARPLLLPLLVLCTAIAGVISGVHLAYYSPTPRYGIIAAEMGRYSFPVITALATLALGCAFALRRRWVVPIAAGLAVLVMGTGFAGQLTELARFYAAI